MFSPKEVAVRYVAAGQKKLGTAWYQLLILGIMAGAFIALAAAGAGTASSMAENPGMAKLTAALLFPGGLAMVILAGSELFTGDCLIIITVLEGKARLTAVLKCWFFVYTGNLIGSAVVAWLVNRSGQFSLFDGGLAMATIRTAVWKTSLPFEHAFILGILCNFLVCIAVWIGMAGKSLSDKILGIYFPILLFVVSGFEHSVANMYYIPAGIFASRNPVYAAMAAEQGIVVSGLDWGSFALNNLVPVTLGNIVGGSMLVGSVYWMLYLKNGKQWTKGE